MSYMVGCGAEAKRLLESIGADKLPCIGMTIRIFPNEILAVSIDVALMAASMLELERLIEAARRERQLSIEVRPIEPEYDHGICSQAFLGERCVRHNLRKQAPDAEFGDAYSPD